MPSHQNHLTRQMVKEGHLAIYEAVEMKEIKVLGRGGQGAVTAAQILAQAAFIEGYWAQTFPQFGAERRGAPVIAYIRFDHEPIAIRSKVYSPDVVIVMDLNLFHMLDPLSGMKAGGIAIINCPDKAIDLITTFLERVSRIYTVDASTIAHEIYGRTAIPVTNVITVGAYCAAQKDISLESVYRVLPEFFQEDKMEINSRALQRGYESLREIL